MDFQLSGISSDLLAKAKRLQLVARRSIDSDLMGMYRSAFRGSGLVFSDLREYQAGDDISHIHWKVTARTGKAYVKTYEEDRQLRVIVLLDISRSVLAGLERGRIQRALTFTALLTLLTQRSGDRMGLALFGNGILEYLPPSNRRSHYHRLIAALSRPRQSPAATDISKSCEQLLSKEAKRSIVFLVSDFWDQDYERGLQLLKHKHDLICAQVNEPIEQELPACGLVEFQDAESGEPILIDTSQQRINPFLEEQDRRRKSELKRACTRVGADYLELGEDLVSPLSRLMKQRMRRLR